MAKLEITIAELIDILIANKIIPEKISDIDIQGETINFKYNTGMMIPHEIDAFVNFVEFEKGIIILEMHTTWFADKVLRLASLPENNYVQLDYPQVIFYIERFLKDKVIGLMIEDIKFTNGKFIITTYNI